MEHHGDLRKHAKDDQKHIEMAVDDDTIVGELVARLGATEREEWNAALDGQVVYPTDRLVDGASVIVFPPIAGG